MLITRGVWFVILALALTGLSYGLFLPSLQRYVTVSTSSEPPGLHSTNTIFSVIVAIYSVGECFGTFMFGKLYRHCSMRKIWLISYAGAILGTILYVFPSIPTVLISRFLCGIWTGGISNLARSYVADTVPLKDQTQILSIALAVSTLCFAASPGFAGLFTFYDFQIMDIAGTTIYVNEFTSPAWVLWILCFVALGLVVVFCDDFQTPEERRSQATAGMSSPLAFSATRLTIMSGLWIMFCSTIGFSIVETMFTPIVADKWGVSLKSSSIPFIIAGAMLFVTAIGMKFLTMPLKRYGNKGIVSDRLATLLSFLFLLAGSLLMTDFQTLKHDPCRSYDGDESSCNADNSCVWNPTYSGHDCDSCGDICWTKDNVMSYEQFIIGFCLSNIGFQIARISVSSMMTKIVFKEKAPTVSALLIFAQGFSRVVAPLFAIQLYDLHTTTFPLMTTVGALYLISIGVTTIQWKRLDRSNYLGNELTERTPFAQDTQ